MAGIINQPFPVIGTKIAEPDGTPTVAYRYFLQSLWNRTGDAPGVLITVVQTTANTALADAIAAQATADIAVINAATAQATANTALADAIAAQATANTAITNAATAQSTANTALANAATAQSGANASLKIASNLSDVANLVTSWNNLAASITQTGWTAPTGTIARTAINGNWTQTISAIPTQAEVQSIVAQLVSVGQGLAALITDETTVKTIGP